MARALPIRVGILGTRWGRTHVGTFRAASCTIHAIVGADPARSRLVAAEEGVAHHDAAALADCDVVVIATPIASHRELVARHTDKILFVEKPLFGRAPDLDDRALVARTDLAVNYAFAFLDTAARVGDLVASGSLGRLARGRLQVDVRLGPPRAALESLRDVAIHPLSWLQHACGPLVVHGHAGDERRVTAALALGEAPLALEVGGSASEGITIAVELACERGTVTVNGGYRPGAGWSFAPVRVDGREHGAGEQATNEDIWYRANRRAVATFVERIADRLDDDVASARGLFSGARALALEAALGPLLTAP